jgi:hypothetical protein
MDQGRLGVRTGFGNVLGSARVRERQVMEMRNQQLSRVVAKACGFPIRKVTVQTPGSEKSISEVIGGVSQFLEGFATIGCGLTF